MKIRRAGKTLSIYPKKSLGQHFCQNSNLLSEVVKRLGVSSDDQVWEIGPGLGNLTKVLAPISKELFVFEIDTRFKPFLEAISEEHPNVVSLWGDVLKIDLQSLFPENKRLLVCGNLPYYCGSAIVQKFLRLDPSPAKMIFVLQKEVARKAFALPGSKDYGFFSASVQLFAKIVYGPEFSPDSFFPSPLVYSSLIELVPLQLSKSERKIREAARSLASIMFGNRRKMAIPLLKKSFPNVVPSWQERFESLKLTPKIRGEEIKLEELIFLSSGL
ncbi:ribosomal RNA small subunit methyltransferase A [bacterium]|nr:ribosomal RNA small subunit methyltransferase A [bacterium]